MARAQLRSSSQRSFLLYLGSPAKFTWIRDLCCIGECELGETGRSIWQRSASDEGMTDGRPDRQGARSHVDKIRSETGIRARAPKCPNVIMLAVSMKRTEEIKAPFEVNFAGNSPSMKVDLLEKSKLITCQASKSGSGKYSNTFTYAGKCNEFECTVPTAPFNPFREPISPSCTYLF